MTDRSERIREDELRYGDERGFVDEERGADRSSVQGYDDGVPRAADRQSEGGLPHAHRDESPLFGRDAAQQFRDRWEEVQTGFVDEPRRAVQEANALVGEVTDRLNEMFNTSRNELERQWSAGENASTEDLRVALQRYRAFFQRLLSL